MYLIQEKQEKQDIQEAQECNDIEMSCFFDIQQQLSLQRFLCQIYGPNAIFKSDEQRQAVEVALANQSDLICILPCGGGKSLVYQLAAKQETKQTIVIVPFSALAQETVDNCAKIGLHSALYSSSTEALGRSRILVVVIDQVVMGHFLEQLNMALGQGLVSRIVIDEPHCILTMSDFRDCMKSLYRFRTLKSQVQVIALSATLPPSLTELIKTELDMANAIIVRGSCDVPNAIYSVQPSDPKWLERIKHLLQVHLKEPSDRAIVFVRMKVSVGCLQGIIVFYLILALLHVSNYRHKRKLVTTLNYLFPLKPLF